MGQLVTAAEMEGQVPAVRAVWRPAAVRIDLGAAVMAKWRLAGRVEMMPAVKDELRTIGRDMKLAALKIQQMAAVWKGWWSAVHHQAFASVHGC